MVENKYYERKIRYLDLMENGERAGGAGFVKTEVKGMDINFSVTVKGLHPTDTYEREVMLQVGDGEFSVGRISLKEGQGQFLYHAVMDYSQLQGIRILLGGTREICCKWQDNKKINNNAKSSAQEKRIPKDRQQGNGMRNIAAQNNEKQYDEIQHGETRNGPGRKKTVLSSILTQLDNGERGKTKEMRELQLIPWDEVRAAEESLEKTEKLLADTAERAGAIERARSAEEAGEAEKVWPSGGIDTAKNIRLAEGIETVENIRPAERIGTTENVRPSDGIGVARGTARGMGMEERAVASGIIGETSGSLDGETTDRDIGKIMPRAAERMSARERNRVAERAAGETVKKAADRMVVWDLDNGSDRLREREAVQSPTTGITGRDIENAATRRAPERRTEKSTRKPTAGNAMRGEKTPVRLLEDKWQQIWAIYPHIHPFQDEREYLSISPADFVLLSGEAYRAANNSFLLHGYYNYDHLILTKIEKRGEISYYIGVPGNYYEREKQVAVMFGFESFECGAEPAQAGDFGYYMMRTQL